MTAPSGWQNLSSTRHKARDPHEVLTEIRVVHHTAVAKPLSDSRLSYWVNDDLIGIAWQDYSSQSWTYVVMSRTALDMGLGCVILPPTSGNRCRIAPRGVVVSSNRRAVPKRFKYNAFLYADDGKWKVLIETSTGESEYGPYETIDIANAQIPLLVEQIRSRRQRSVAAEETRTTA